MMISTGLQTAQLVTNNLGANMSGCVLRMYSGTVPATADAALGGATLLHEYSVGGAGTGGTFETTPVAGALVKKVSETWTGTSVASGDATFGRLVLVADDGTLSTTAKRIQGTVGTSGADILLGNITFTASGSRTLGAGSITQPKS